MARLRLRLGTVATGPVPSRSRSRPGGDRHRRRGSRRRAHWRTVRLDQPYHPSHGSDRLPTESGGSAGGVGRGPHSEPNPSQAYSAAPPPGMLRLRVCGHEARPRRRPTEPPSHWQGQFLSGRLFIRVPTATRPLAPWPHSVLVTAGAQRHRRGDAGRYSGCH